MSGSKRLKITNLAALYEAIPAEERVIVDVLRSIVRSSLPDYCREKISYNVPYFYGHRGICIIWPAGIPRGGIRSGVLLGFWYGNCLQDPEGYLHRGNNKQIFYRIYTSAEAIEEQPIRRLLEEAVRHDATYL